MRGLGIAVRLLHSEEVSLAELQSDAATTIIYSFAWLRIIYTG